uniref:Bone morphogenetic protein 3 n=1 Tax=Scleropages formosus TaxID=113540 RepID=A0A8C9RR23_SCLFO
MAPCEHACALLLALASLLGAGASGQRADNELQAEDAREPLLRDTVSEHMKSLYEKYSAAGFRFKDGNTVRAFRALAGTVEGEQLQIFNLSSLSGSERILSATLHYYVGELRNGTRSCARPSNTCGPRGPGAQRHVQLGIRSFASVDNKTRTLGRFRLNASALHGDSTSWQWRDITRAVDQGKAHDRFLIAVGVVEPRGRGPWGKLLSGRPPYILVYANDSAISEPESVVSTLRGNKGSAPLAPPGLEKLQQQVLARNANGTAARRTNILLPLQNNELPGPEYPYSTTAWEESGPYEPLENKAAKRPRKKLRKNQSRQHKVESTMPLLQFDERTIKKARKKQWNEPRNCARRYLKVDFADIGWSEWIISPKSFDAYYCSGSCEFPMPKSLKPSNHATIQSIVRAVGVVPGIPEPCCVPEKMSSLSILFFDEDKNVVLKVYPNMTVDSCACR